MFYFQGISAHDLSRELLRVCISRDISRDNGYAERPSEQLSTPVFVDIDGDKTQIFGLNWDEKLGAMVLTGVKPPHD